MQKIGGRGGCVRGGSKKTGGRGRWEVEAISLFWFFRGGSKKPGGRGWWEVEDIKRTPL